MSAERKDDRKISEPVILGYWTNARCLAEPIRYMLEYAGVPYKNETCPFLEDQIDSAGGGKAVWMQKRETLSKQGLPFPNLPYLIDGETKLSQSIAIMRYLARKHGLGVPDSDLAAAARLEMLEGQVNDLRYIARRNSNP